MKKSSELYAGLYVREFPAQSLLRLRVDLHKKPCVVIEGEAPLQQICSLNKKAAQLGVVRGMTNVEIDAFPALDILVRSSLEEAATRNALLTCAGIFSPRVEDRSDETTFLCVIDISNVTTLFGPPEILSHKLINCVQSLGVTAGVVVSHNFHTVIALAKGLPSPAVTIIPIGEESAALATLPITVFDLTQEQLQTFSLWGVRTLGMLAALPEKGLIARMGQSGKRLRQLARGEMPHFFYPMEPGFRLEEHTELDQPVEFLDALLFILGIMLDRLVLRAKARALTLTSISIMLTLDGGTTRTYALRPALPSADKQFWIKLLHLELESHPPAAPIVSLSLAAQPGAASKVQYGLFSPPLPEPSRLDVTLAHITNIVGKENVGRAVLNDTHQPEGFRMESFRITSDSTSLPSSHCLSAMRRLRPPENVYVTLQGRSPSEFIFRQKRYIVDQIYGPWLTDGEWWSQTLWSLEQWDLVAYTRDGNLLCCCITHDSIENCWQMAGLYD